MIVEITAMIGSASTGKPNTLRMSISPIIPPPGMAPITAPTKNETAKMAARLEKLVMSFPNKANKKTILNTPPKTDPSLCVLAPSGMTVSAISIGTPIFCVEARLTGMDAALEHVEIAVTDGGSAFFQKVLIPSEPPAMKA